MQPRPSAKSILELERAILRLLCSDAVRPSARHTATQKLTNYEWKEAEHRVVYEALREFRQSGPLSLREQLPAHATRLGFPDVDWQNYFHCGPSKDEEVDVLIRRLVP